jgi:hypothetical protein
MFLDKDLQRHGSEFARAIRNLKFDQCESGIYFPAQRVIAQGVYRTRVNGGAWEDTPNLVPTEGLTYLMSLLGAGSKLPNWYVALYAGAITPVSTWTASNFAANATEITSGTEGYTEANRVAWVPGTAAAGAIDSNASPATFTIATATTLAVNGVAMLSASAKGATSGVLVSAARFGATRNFVASDTFDVKYGLSLTS